MAGRAALVVNGLNGNQGKFAIMGRQSERQPPCRGLRGLLATIFGAVLLVNMMVSINPALARDSAAPADDPVSLIDVWLAFPNLGTLAWPYSYIRAKTSNDLQKTRMQDLFRELDALDWRLENGPYRRYRPALDEWRSALEAVPAYRVPGTWSPSWLMAHPNQNPPVSALTAVGTCGVPSWIEIWDSNGVNRLQWTAGLTLSDVTRRLGPVDAGPSDEVTLVSSNGSVVRYGVAGWNFADTRLQPGARVVAALPLEGDGLLWIRDTIARLLAHSASGVNCRELPISGAKNNG